MVRKVTSSPDLYGPAPGREMLDSTPIALPLGYTHPETTEEIVMRLLRSEQLARLAAAEGVETFDEFMDFGDESDDDPRTPHEEFWDPVFRRPTTLVELQELDRTLKGGGTVQFSEDDALQLRRHLREVAEARQPIPPAEPPVAAPAATPAPSDPPVKA